MEETKKEKKQETKFREAEGKLEAVGTQGGTMYLVVSGRRVDISENDEIIIKIKK